MLENARRILAADVEALHLRNTALEPLRKVLKELQRVERQLAKADEVQAVNIQQLVEQELEPESPLALVNAARECVAAALGMIGNHAYGGFRALEHYHRSRLLDQFYLYLRERGVSPSVLAFLMLYAPNKCGPHEKGYNAAQERLRAAKLHKLRTKFVGLLKWREFTCAHDSSQV